MAIFLLETFGKIGGAAETGFISNFCNVTGIFI
jgi:hypothetical protein